MWHLVAHISKVENWEVRFIYHMHFPPPQKKNALPVNRHTVNECQWPLPVPFTFFLHLWQAPCVMLNLQTCQNVQWRLAGGLQTPEHNPEHTDCNLNAVLSAHKLSNNTVKQQNGARFELFAALLAKLSCLNSYVLLLSIPKRNHYISRKLNALPQIQSHSTILHHMFIYLVIIVYYYYCHGVQSSSRNQVAFASKGHIRKQRSKLPVNSCCDCQSTSIHLGSWKIAQSHVLNSEEIGVSRLQKLSDRYSQAHALVYLEKSLHKYVRPWNHRYFSGNSYKLFGTLWIRFGGMVKSVLFPSPHLTASPCDWNSCKQRPSVKDQRRRVPSWPLLKASGKLMDTSAFLEMLAKDSIKAKIAKLNPNSIK